MLPIKIPAGELWDEKKEQLIITKECTLHLEHSLISISEWESKWCVPFYDSEKTEEQVFDYIRCMTIDRNIDPNVYYQLTAENVKAINQYIAAPMTASTVSSNEKNNKLSGERVTSELIYYWMIQYNIPVSFEKWHLNRLIMLIRICSEKNKPAKKMSRSEIMRQNRALNQARRARLHSKG